jgi:DNA mismatch repair protein MSH4
MEGDAAGADGGGGGGGGGGERSSFVIGLIENRANEVSHAAKLPPHFPGCSINPRELG